MERDNRKKESKKQKKRQIKILFCTKNKTQRGKEEEEERGIERKREREREEKSCSGGERDRTGGISQYQVYYHQLVPASAGSTNFSFFFPCVYPVYVLLVSASSASRLRLLCRRRWSSCFCAVACLNRRQFTDWREVACSARINLLGTRRKGLGDAAVARSCEHAGIFPVTERILQNNYISRDRQRE